MYALYVCLLTTMAGLSWSQPQQPCCVPDLWEGVQSSIIGEVKQGTGEVTRIRSAISYDYHDQRIATLANITLHSGEVLRLLTISLYREMTSYSVDLETKMCTKQMLKSEMVKQCIPDNAQKVADVFFGDGQQEAPLVATQYAFQVASPENGMVTGSVTVTKDCTPVTETVFGDVNGEQVLQAVQFVNIHFGISNPDIFQVPDVCEGAPEEMEERERLPGLFSV